MPHGKFQSPSINIDRYFQLSARERKKGREKERKKERKGVSKWGTQDVELRVCPKGKGGAKKRNKNLEENLLDVCNPSTKMFAFMYYSFSFCWKNNVDYLGTLCKDTYNFHNAITGQNIWDFYVYTKGKIWFWVNVGLTFNVKQTKILTSY